MPITCPACGNAASGKFCSHCGTPLETPVSCGRCGTELPAGGRFCNMCGAPGPAEPAAAAATKPMPSTTSGPGPRLAWILAGAAILALLVVVLIGRGGRDEPPAAPPLAATGGGPGAVDLSSLTPREAADRLFDRVMRSVSANDSVEARAFAPMAIAAYEMAEPLDLDGRYHLAVLHLVNEDPTAAMREAEVILDEVPTHLFGLFTAGQAEQLSGNREGAVDYYRRFLQNFEAEVARGRPEYAEHPLILEPMRAEAELRAG